MDESTRDKDFENVLQCLKEARVPLSLTQLCKLSGVQDPSHLRELLAVLERDDIVRTWKLLDQDGVVVEALFTVKSSAQAISTLDLQGEIAYLNEGLIEIDENLDTLLLSTVEAPDVEKSEQDVHLGLPAQHRGDLQPPNLSAAEKLRLAVEAAKGDTKAKEQLLKSFLPRIRAIARNLSNRQSDVQDLVQAGAEGAMIGLRKFDVIKSSNVDAYVNKWIKSAIWAEIYEQQNSIRPTDYIRKLIKKVRKCASALRNKLDRRPSDSEVIAATLLSEKQVKWTLAVEQVLSVASLDEPSPASEFDAADDDSQASDNSDFQEMSVGEEESLVNRVDSLLSTLTAKQREIVELRFGFKGGDGMTLEEIAKRFNIRKQTVYKQEAAALRKLRQNKESAQMFHDFFGLLARAKADFKRRRPSQHQQPPHPTFG